MLRGKDASLGNSMLGHPGACHPHLVDFLEIFTIGRYHKDMKILKILALTPSGPEFMGFWKTGKLMMIEGVAKYYIFLDNFCLK